MTLKYGYRQRQEHKMWVAVVFFFAGLAVVLSFALALWWWFLQ